MKIKWSNVPLAQSVLAFWNNETGVTKTAWLVWGFFVFLIPFQLHYNYILNLFYHIGAGFPDSGLFAAVSWRNDLRLSTPLAYESRNVSFLAIHFTPLLWVLSQLSYFIPTYKPEYYGAYTAMSYAMISVALFCVFHAVTKPKNQLHMAFISVICMLFAFNLAIVKGMWYVHVEYAVIMSLFFFLLSYLRGYNKLSIFFLILTILQREDGGFHVASVMGLLLLVKFWETRSLAEVKREMWFTFFALLGGACTWGATFLIRELDVGRTQSNWELMYSGNPAFAHLKLALVGERLQNLFYERIYIWAGFLITLAWATWRRSLYYMIGFVATIPWFLLHLVSFQTMTGHFDAYYPFPFIIGLGWPLFAVMARYGASPTVKVVREAVVMQVVLLALSIVTWNSGAHRFGLAWTDGLYGGLTLKEGAYNRALVQHFVMQFDGGAGDLGTVRADSGMSSLIAGKYKGKDVPYWYVKDQKIDTMIYMSSNPKQLSKEVLDTAQSNDMTHNYCMPGTTVCLLTNRSTQQLGALAGLLEPTPVDPAVFKKSGVPTPTPVAAPVQRVPPQQSTAQPPQGTANLKGINFKKLFPGL